MTSVFHYHDFSRTVGLWFENLHPIETLRILSTSKLGPLMLGLSAFSMWKLFYAPEPMQMKWSYYSSAPVAYCLMAEVHNRKTWLGDSKRKFQHIQWFITLEAESCCKCLMYRFPVGTSRRCKDNIYIVSLGKKKKGEMQISLKKSHLLVYSLLRKRRASFLLLVLFLLRDTVNNFNIISLTYRSFK